MHPRGGGPAHTWWDTAVVYQIYPRSFADSDGDGVGDLGGVTDRLPYIADLGVDAIWMTPFYPSPWADGGYDVSDYRSVDPRLGTLADFDELVDRAGRLGLKVIIDIVPNHTSSRHPWFLEALDSPPGSRARGRYIFRDGVGTAPPSDWRSHFGGSAWTQVEDGQWYCHLFDHHQPDLNWDDDEVRQEFLSILRFWADRGVAGFRVDVAHALAKDLSEPLRSQPHLDSRLPVDGTDPLYDRDEVHAIYRTWREVFDSYDPPLMAVAETWYPPTERSRLYARRSELGQVFEFGLLKAAWLASSFRDVIDTSLAAYARDAAHGGGGTTWVLSSHDVPRHASRLALPPHVAPEQWLVTHGEIPRIDAGVGVARARAAALVMLALPGSPYLYQGEELGLPEVADLPVSALADPVWHRSNQTVKGRDGCRVPLPWTRTGPSFGFGEAGGWLPQPPTWGELSVEAQLGRDGSTLELYRRALTLRRTLSDLDGFSFEWLASPPGVLSFRRGGAFVCTVNFGDDTVPLPDDQRVLLSSSGSDSVHQLAPSTAVWSISATS
ncbi:glycoside hydrolase family 13 protein [Nocardioides pyridinolyticus]